MPIFKLEHSRLGYWADFAFYAVASLTLVSRLVVLGPRARLPHLAGLVLLGLASWTLMEYVLHRFVMHQLPPFKRWHGEHHDRPMALISSPTYFTALLFAVLVFLPALWLADAWGATALTCGLMMGFLAFSVMHHAVHHWRASNPWFKSLKRLHALHHHSGSACCYGVTTLFWDRVFGTLKPR